MSKEEVVKPPPIQTFSETKKELERMKWEKELLVVMGEVAGESARVTEANSHAKVARGERKKRLNQELLPLCPSYPAPVIMLSCPLMSRLRLRDPKRRTRTPLRYPCESGDEVFGSGDDDVSNYSLQHAGGGGGQRHR